jgi:hypothetical protein
MDKIVFLRLRSDDLKEGAILVEQQIRVSVAQNACAFGCKHKQLVSSIWNEEGSTAVLTPFQRVTSLRHLPFSCIVNFTGYVLVTLGIQLVRGVVADSGQGLDYSRFGRGGLG